MTEAELCAYWAALRTRVAAMAAADGERLIFGAHSPAWGHDYYILPPVPEESLRRFETRNRLRLPMVYRTFLRCYGAGGAGPDYGIADFSFAIAPHDFTVPSPVADTIEHGEEHAGEHREGLGYLGTAGCGIDWYIELNGPRPGTVWRDGEGMLCRYEDFHTWMDRWAARVERSLESIARFRLLSERHAASALTVEAAAAVLGPEVSRRRDEDGTWSVWFALGGGHLRCDSAGSVLSIVGPRKGGLGS